MNARAPTTPSVAATMVCVVPFEFPGFVVDWGVNVGEFAVDVALPEPDGVVARAAGGVVTVFGVVCGVVGIVGGREEDGGGGGAGEGKTI